MDDERKTLGFRDFRFVSILTPVFQRLVVPAFLGPYSKDGGISKAMAATLRTAKTIAKKKLFCL